MRFIFLSALLASACHSASRPSPRPTHPARLTAETAPVAAPAAVRAVATAPVIEEDATAITAAEPAHRGPRVLTAPTSVRARPISAEPPATTIPEGYRRVQAIAPPPYRGRVWLLRPDAQGEPTCQRWRFQPTPEGVTLERRYRQAWGSGVSVEREFIPLHGGPVTFAMYSMGFGRRWLRRPGPREGMPGMRGAAGCVTPITVVSADDHRIEWVEGRNVIAYHPDDTHVWYLDEATCEADRDHDAPHGGC